ncbi:31 kDa ribonucleoprotein, chloroplastic-like [Bidens hawaiensis]|uniref:31 kDa ribonucleoprotein, chloroplastic-like n=1 Tax=Bidens hawaiensis TaxID=980011 RepID=UPI004048FD91
MSVEEGYRCFVGGLIKSMTDRALFEVFLRFGYVLDAEVVLDKVSGLSLGYGFVTFAGKDAMNNAIAEMNGYNLDGTYISVSKAQPQAGPGRDYRHNGGSQLDLHLPVIMVASCLEIGALQIKHVASMSDHVGYCCFVGGLSWSTTDKSLFEAFVRFGYVLDAKVVFDMVSGRSRGYGFVTFVQVRAMNAAIKEMNGYKLDGSYIRVSKAQSQAGSRRNYDDRGSDCFRCGKPGHIARECSSKGGNKGDSYGGSGNRYGGGWYGERRSS